MKDLKRSHPQYYLLLVWFNSKPNPSLLTSFTSNEYGDIQQLSELGKGELADVIEGVLGTKLDPYEFDTEEITYSDFQEEYGHENNPNKIVLSKAYNVFEC